MTVENCPFCHEPLTRASIQNAGGKHEFCLRCGRSAYLIDLYEVFCGLPTELQRIALDADRATPAKRAQITRAAAKAFADNKRRRAPLLAKLKREVERNKSAALQ